ncbi:EAL domain-containing protein [Varunaivibrio sulfuroxidans]|uniref:EAL domain-containing protein n=1 Tax=Varunaivibrio sulfuroxidans TaxID=1773489 RepID=A0A4R3JGR4_9PROT|nr:hypothetical protein [Varunaivibrio sulfuroxidans]TCS65134.1 hypothetical protein EDD55_101468 [Varunaivibrio sulfuroxidans]WES29580.1 hypothetical protein P3M64_07920 [Varunaivibrio sulfuroxidans]
MTSTSSPSPKTSENLLLHYLRRLEKQPQGRSAVHVRLSGLRPMNRRERHIRAAVESFEALITSLRGQLFLLRNMDLFFLFKDEVRSDVETIVQKIKFLFSDDPLLDERETPDATFVEWYDLDRQFNEIVSMVEAWLPVDKAGVDTARKTSAKEKPNKGASAAKPRGRGDVRAQLKARQQFGDPLTPQGLARFEGALLRTDLSSLVRRQYICGVDKRMAPTPTFSELFISISDLRETMLPGVNLTSNRWLFQHLTESLDRRMLSLLSKADSIDISGEISFNVNISTLLTPEFMSFDDNISASRRGSMVLELQKVDIFADLGAFFFAREYVQERGYRLCLDGLTHHTLPMIDRARLGVDLVKVIWHPEFVDGGPRMHDRVAEMIEKAGPDKVIICRCDTREAVDFGKSVGVTLFQGRYIEQLIVEDERRREMLRLKRRIDRSNES